MPDVFDPHNIPAEFAQTSQLAEDQLTKLENSDQKILGSESSTLNLLSSGLTSQAKVLNTLIDKLDSFQLKAGNELGTEVQDQFNRHVTLTRKLQKSAIQTSLKDQGLFPDTANIQLICPLYTEEGGATNTVPETLWQYLRKNIVAVFEEKGQDSFVVMKIPFTVNIVWFGKISPFLNFCKFFLLSWKMRLTD